MGVLRYDLERDALLLERLGSACTKLCLIPRPGTTCSAMTVGARQRRALSVGRRAAVTGEGQQHGQPRSARGDCSRFGMNLRQVGRQRPGECGRGSYELNWGSPNGLPDPSGSRRPGATSGAPNWTGTTVQRPSSSPRWVTEGAGRHKPGRGADLWRQTALGGPSAPERLRGPRHHRPGGRNRRLVAPGLGGPDLTKSELYLT
jgi:hypothetical protein